MTHETKTRITATVFALMCMALYFFFPVEKRALEIFTAVPLFLVVLPMLFTRIVLHRDQSAYGNGSYAVPMRAGLFLAIATVVGILTTWVFVKLGWGVEAYKATVTDAIFYSFKGFVFFELAFSLLMLWIFTFFAWGFVYHGTLQARTASFFLAMAVFVVFLLNHFDASVLLVPLLMPVAVYWWFRGRIHTMYVAWAVFLVNLALDTILIITL